MRWVVGSTLRGGPIKLFSPSSQCSTTGVTKAVVMYYYVGKMVHIKEPLLLIGNSSPCGGSECPLTEWSFTICPTSYNHK